MNVENMLRFKRLLRSLAVWFGVIAILSISSASAFASEKPEIFVQIGHTSSINAIEISPDNKFILSGSDDRSVKLWEAATGRLIRTFKDSDSIKFVSFLPGGKSFFSLNDKGNVCIWDIPTGNKTKEFSLGEISFASLKSAVSYDGITLRVIVGLKLYATAILTGTITQSIERPKSAPVSSYLGFGFGFRNAITADGRRMLSSVTEDPSESAMDSKYKKLMLWDISTGRIISTFIGHNDLVDVIILSPDDKLALSGSRDKTIRLWDLKSGKAIATFAGHQKDIEAVAISPDRKYVLSGSNDNTMKLWDIAKEKEIRTFAHDCPVTFVRFSPDGLFALSGDHKGALRIWDIKTGREAKALKNYTTNSYAMALSADGNYVLTGSNDGQIRLWDAASGKLQKTISAHSEAISAVKFTPDSKYALSVSWDKTLKLWDLNEGKLQRTFSGHPGQVYKAVISPDGLYVLSSAQDDDVRLWNISSGAEIKAFKFPGMINSIGFSADSRHLVIAHNQKKLGNAVKVLTLDGIEVKNYDDVYLGRYSNDGKYFLANSFKEPTDKEQRLFDPETKQKKPIFRRDGFNKETLVEITDGKVLGHFGQSGAIVYVSTSANNDIILTKNYYDQDICLWDVLTGKEVHRFPVKFGLLSPNGSKVIAPAGKTLQTFDTTTGRGLPAFNGSATGDISSFALSAKGGYAVTGDNTGAIQFWDVTGSKLIKTIKAEAREAIVAVAFSPDNKHAASLSRFGAAKIWDLRKGNKVSEFKTNFIPTYYDELEAGDYVDYGNGILAFSPDGRYLASGSMLWEVDSGRKALDFQTPFGPGPWVTFSPDGNYLLSRNMIWDVSSGRRVKTLESIKDAKSVYSSDGNFIYAADAEGPFYVVDSETGKLVRKFINFVSAGSFEVSPDKKMLIAAETNYNDLTLWDLTSGKKSATIEINQSISSVLLSADARKAVLNNWVSVRQFNIATGKEIAQFISFTDSEWVVITPEGYFNASPNGAKHLNVRVGNNVYSIDNFYEKFFNPVYVASVLQGKKVEAVADIRKGFLTPPDVKITSPEPNTSFSTDTVTITVSAKDTGGGIDEIRLYHNDKAIGEDTRGVKIVPKGSETIKTYTVALVDGLNTFRATAFSKDRTESNPYELLVKLTAPSKDISMYLFAVGINNYKNPALNLNYAEPDARGIVDFFKQKGKGLFKNVELREIYNEHATKENITAKLKQLENTNPQDAVLIYLAGHGENVNDKWYFIPHELTYPEREEDVKAKGISSDELSGYIKNIKAQKILLLIDACKSGAVLVAFRGFEDRKALSQLSRSTGVHIVAASTKDQFAAEVKELGHGVFTYILLEGLKGKAAGKGETVTVRKLMGYIEEKLPEITKKYKQEAQYPVVDSRGMDFPLVILK